VPVLVQASELVQEKVKEPVSEQELEPASEQELVEEVSA